MKKARFRNRVFCLGNDSYFMKERQKEEGVKPSFFDIQIFCNILTLFCVYAIIPYIKIYNFKELLREAMKHLNN